MSTFSPLCLVCEFHQARVRYVLRSCIVVEPIRLHSSQLLCTLKNVVMGGGRPGVNIVVLSRDCESRNYKYFNNFIICY